MKNRILKIIFVSFVSFFGFLFFKTEQSVLAILPADINTEINPDIILKAPTSTPTPTIPILKLKEPVFKIMPDSVSATPTTAVPTPTLTTTIAPVSGTPAVTGSVEEVIESTVEISPEPTQTPVTKAPLIGTKEAIFIGTIALLLAIIALQGRSKKETKEEGPTQ